VVARKIVTIVFADLIGSTALHERLDAESVRLFMERYYGAMRAAVELAKDWRTDRVLRRLEAMLAVADLEASLIITGNGDVLAFAYNNDVAVNGIGVGGRGGAGETGA